MNNNWKNNENNEEALQDEVGDADVGQVFHGLDDLSQNPLTQNDISSEKGHDGAHIFSPNVRHELLDVVRQYLALLGGHFPDDRGHG